MKANVGDWLVIKGTTTERPSIAACQDAREV
jgi:hypothetical protein